MRAPVLQDRIGSYGWERGLPEVKRMGYDDDDDDYFDDDDDDS